MRSDLNHDDTVNSSVASEGVRDLGSSCSSSRQGSCFKENIHVNKSETPKLSMEPQQMKKKKKGGYNLRKSLAWDRAFFTEEGILDPLELSIVTGASCGEGLLFTGEDTPVKNNILKLPDEDARKNFLSPKPDSSSSKTMISASQASLIVSASAGDKSGSRCGECPRPLPPLSLKRPVNVNAGKAAAKESKLLKVPVTKPVLGQVCSTNKGTAIVAKISKGLVDESKAASKDSNLTKIPVSRAVLGPVCATNKSTTYRGNRLKPNHVAQPDFSIQKAVQSKSFCEIPNTRNASKASSLRLDHYSERNSGNTSIKRYSSVNSSPVLVDNADNSSSKMISDSMPPPRPVHSSEGREEPKILAAPSSQHSLISGRTMEPSRGQIMKPSGLRMPSPSLSFFSQPKASVLQELSLRNKDTNECGSQRPVRDNSSRALKVDIPRSSSCHNRAITARSVCLASSHVNDVSHDTVESNLGLNSMHKIGMKRGCLNPDPIANQLFNDNSCSIDGDNHNSSGKIATKRISQDVVEPWKTDHETPSENRSYERSVDEKNLMKTTPDCSVDSESCGSGWTNPELISKQNNGIHYCETKITTSGPYKEQTCNLTVLNHGDNMGSQSEDVFNHRRQNSMTMQSHCKETCKTDFNEALGEETHHLNCSPGETDEKANKDMNGLKTNERLNEQLGVSLQNGSWCSEITNVEVLENKAAEAESTYSESKHQLADLLKEAPFIDIMTDKLDAREAHTQDLVCASAIGGCKENINPISSFGDYSKQFGEFLKVPSLCLRVEEELQRDVGLNTSGICFPNKQICIQKSQQEKNVEKPVFRISERKACIGLIENKMASTQYPAETHDCNIDEDRMMNQSLVGREFHSADNPLASENQTKTIFSHHDIDVGKAVCHTFSCETTSAVAFDRRWRDDNDLRSNELINVIQSGPFNGNLSKSLDQDSQTTGIDSCSSFSEIRSHEVPQKYTLEKVPGAGPVIEYDCVNNWLISSSPLKEDESDTNNLINEQESGAQLVHSPESSELNECCFKQSESLTFQNDEIAAAILHVNDRLPIENYMLRESSASDAPSGDNVLEGIEDSVMQHNGIHVDILTDSNSDPELPIKHESCSDAFITDGQSYITADTITDHLKVEPFSNINSSEVSEDTYCSVSKHHPELDKDRVEVALAQNNKCGNGLNEKCHTNVLPQDAIPFSDEWLAAIEAAGEDILTKKGGAVQNSPPEKSPPEPSPWSPVKKKTNQIGPFDCTKYTNFQPSDS